MFEQENKAYKKVLEHRQNCPKWGEEFCLECFGGGLTKFRKDFDDEFNKELGLPPIEEIVKLQIMIEKFRKNRTAVNCSNFKGNCKTAVKN